MPDRSRKVVLLIDYDNLQICATRDTPGRDLQLEPVVQLAQKYGTVMHARAYAEWNLSTERLAVYKLGIEPAFAPVLRTEGDRSGKSLADTVMVAEGMDILWTLAPEVLILATSDKDLIPLVRVAKQRGAHVVVVGSDFTAVPLREMADEHVSYKQIITEASARLTSFVPGRTPPTPAEPVRLARGTHRDRDRDRTPREPRPAAEQQAAPETAAAAPAPVPAQPQPTSPPEAAGGLSSESELPPGARRRRRRTRRRSDRVGSESENDVQAERASPGQGDDAPVEREPLPEVADVPAPLVADITPERPFVEEETVAPSEQPLALPDALEEEGVVPSKNGAGASTEEEAAARPARTRVRRTTASRRRATPPAE